MTLFQFALKDRLVSSEYITSMVELFKCRQQPGKRLPTKGKRRKKIVVGGKKLASKARHGDMPSRN